MLLKSYIALSFALFFVCGAESSGAQTIQAAQESKYPMAVGVGISGYNSGFGSTPLFGSELWLDFYPNKIPEVLRGIGLEIEARDLNYGSRTNEPANLREDTAMGGLIYSWRRYHSIRPYGRFVMGYGNADDGVIKNGGIITHRNHDSRTISAMGGGIELHAFGNVWGRVDYEYQKWPNIFKATKPYGELNPQGITVGALYRFGNRSSFR